MSTRDVKHSRRTFPLVSPLVQTHCACMCIRYARHIRIQGIPEVACFPHNRIMHHYACIQINTNDGAVKWYDNEDKFRVNK